MKTSKAIVLLTSLTVIALAASATPALADSSTPLNYVGVNFAPITTSISSNYDWSTGELTAGTATGSVSSTANVLEGAVSDPTPPAPNGYGTFIGTARPVRNPTGGGAVLYEQSVCGTPTCFVDGTFTYGYMVMYAMRGSTLDQLTNLQTMYYVDDGGVGSNCFGGGSPRFDIVLSNGTTLGLNNLPEIHVYLGTYPAFADCPAKNTWTSTGQLATDSAGLRWDSSSILGSFYGTYSEAVTLADAQGYTIDSILVSTDGGWSGTNAGPTGTGQTFLFQDIQTNSLTRFP